MLIPVSLESQAARFQSFARGIVSDIKGTIAGDYGDLDYYIDANRDDARHLATRARLLGLLDESR